MNNKRKNCRLYFINCIFYYRGFSHFMDSYRFYLFFTNLVSFKLTVNGSRPTPDLQTALFLIGKFLARDRLSGCAPSPEIKLISGFPLSICVAGCFKRLHELPVSKTKPQHCNYNLTINLANQQLTQQHLSSTQSEKPFPELY